MKIRVLFPTTIMRAGGGNTDRGLHGPISCQEMREISAGEVAKAEYAEAQTLFTAYTPAAVG